MRRGKRIIVVRRKKKPEAEEVDASLFSLRREMGDGDYYENRIETRYTVLQEIEPEHLNLSSTEYLSRGQIVSGGACPRAIC